MSEVLIDGALPRTELERIERIFSFFYPEPAGDNPAVHDVLLREARDTANEDGYGEWLHEVEDNLIDWINADLGFGLVVFSGIDPGDLLVGTAIEAEAFSVMSEGYPAP